MAIRWAFSLLTFLLKKNFERKNIMVLAIKLLITPNTNVFEKKDIILSINSFLICIHRKIELVVVFYSRFILPKIHRYCDRGKWSTENRELVVWL